LVCLKMVVMGIRGLVNENVCVDASLW
jgi:hypothetical protein